MSILYVSKKMKKIKINNKFISYKNKPFIIAEVSANHKNSIKRVFKMLEAAAKAGVDAVKFQTFDVNEMTLNLKKKNSLLKISLKLKVGILELYIVFIKRLNYL